MIVSYNNGKLLEVAIQSVVGQTRPVDEIIVSDDASTDESRSLIEALARIHPAIKPVLRERNLGVAANRDLGIREAHGDFITQLDGDDHFLPTKIEAEAKALGERSHVIAYSDVRIIDRNKHRVRTDSIGDFARLGPSGRIRWLVSRKRQSPAAMLIPRDVHLKIGGYTHDLRTYEDWDYILRLAAQPLRWIHSGTEGLAHHPGGGLSIQDPIDHLRDELLVLRLNRKLVSRHAGLPTLMATAGRTTASRGKWWVVFRYREATGQRTPRRRQHRGALR